MKKHTEYKLVEQLSSESGNNQFFNRIATICSFGVVFVAVLGLLGWIPSLSVLGNISPNFIPMAPTTSLCFLFLGLIILIQIRYRLRGASRLFAVSVTLLLSVFGIMELAEHFGTGIDIEDFFIPDVGMLGPMRKARMSPATGATFFLSAMATLLVLVGDTKNKQVRMLYGCSGIIGSLVTITGITILMSYLYDDPLLYGSHVIPMAATTAIGFVFLGVGLVAAAGPDHMPVRLLAGSSARAKLLRAFLPLSILIVLSQDILHRSAFGSSHINTALLEVLLLMFFAAVTGVIVTVMAGAIGRALEIAEEKVKALSKFPSENPNPVLRITEDGKILYSNEAGKLILSKWNCEVGKRVHGKWYNLIAQAFGAEKGKAAVIEEIEEIEGRVFSIAITPVKAAGYANLYAIDITGRRRAEQQLQAAFQQLRAHEQQLQAAFQQLRAHEQQLKAANQQLRASNQQLMASEAKTKELAKFPSEDPNPVLRVSSNGTILYANSAGSMILNAWECEGAERLPESYRKTVEEALASGKPTTIESECPSGRIFSVMFAPVVDSGYANIYGLDITEHKATENKLRDQRQRLQSLASELSKAEEQTRREIAVELHDKIGHDLAITKMKLESLLEELTNTEYYNQTNEIVNLMVNSIKDVSSFTFELSPAVLYELGLDAAMKWFTSEFEKQTDIVCRFKGDNQSKSLPSDMQVLLFRCVRELLANVRKHAQAKTVSIVGGKDSANYRITVEDNGVGFDPSSVTMLSSSSSGSGGGGGHGLFSITERMDYHGGSVEIYSKPQEGTRITLTIPLSVEM